MTGPDDEGLSYTTFGDMTNCYRKVYGGVNDGQAFLLKQVQQKNSRLRKLVVEHDLEIEVMKEITAKKW